MLAAAEQIDPEGRLAVLPSTVSLINFRHAHSATYLDDRLRGGVTLFDSSLLHAAARPLVRGQSAKVRPWRCSRPRCALDWQLRHLAQGASAAVVNLE